MPLLDGTAMRLFLAFLAFAGLASFVAAQSPLPPPPKSPADRSPLRDTEREVVLEGCLYGNRLKIAGDNLSNRLVTDLLGTTEFVLDGPKETLRQLKSAHDGHQDQVTGIVVIPYSRTEQTEVSTKEIGKKTRVTAGGKSPSTDSLEPSTKPKPVRFKFVSLKHLADKCSIPG